MSDWLDELDDDEFYKLMDEIDRRVMMEHAKRLDYLLSLEKHELGDVHMGVN